MVVASLGGQEQLHYRLVCLTRVGVVATQLTYTFSDLLGVKGQEFLVQVISDAYYIFMKTQIPLHPSVATF